MSVSGRSYLLRERIYDLDEQLKMVESVTKEDVIDTAKQIFDYNKVTLSYVGQDANEGLLKIFLKG
jgi:predicted Zn-dependent peptidase